MKIHYIRLYYLKNKITILGTSLAFILLTMLFLQIILINSNDDLTQTNSKPINEPTAKFEALQASRQMLSPLPINPQQPAIKEPTVTNPSIEINPPKVNEKQIIEADVQIHVQDDIELRIR